MQKFKKLMKAYKLLIELYEVEDYMICATSAMRESENGAQLVDEVYQELGIRIEVIDGAREAELINKAISFYVDAGTYLHIDVGGGSTELNLFVNGAKTKTRSFKIGSVRILEHHDIPIMWEHMEKWIRDVVKREYGPVIAIGTGGNISKLYELSSLKPGKMMSIKKLHEVRELIMGYSIEDRIYKLQMNPDRADVIVPASDIYIKVMLWANAKKIFVPDAGLKDGMMQYLYERNVSQQKISFT